MFVLTVEYEYGRTVTGHHTLKEAREEILDYVDRNWVTTRGDEEPPADPMERVEAYFDDLDDEHFDIDEITRIVGGHRKVTKRGRHGVGKQWRL